MAPMVTITDLVSVDMTRDMGMDMDTQLTISVHTSARVPDRIRSRSLTTRRYTMQPLLHPISNLPNLVTTTTTRPRLLLLRIFLPTQGPRLIRLLKDLRILIISNRHHSTHHHSM